MPILRPLAGLAIATGVLFATGAAAGLGASRDVPRCKQSYAYAGAQDSRPRSGIRVRLTLATSPHVATDGHVAGWIGVGGVGEGPKGADEWLQAGYVSFEDGGAQAYYELVRPGQPHVYRPIKERVAPGETHLLTVLETASKHGSWRIWIDNKAASPVIALAASHNRFVPEAEGETWNAGTQSCNSYGYRFVHIQVARAPGGSWGRPKAGYVYRDVYNRATKIGPDSFDARSITADAAVPDDRPPLLGLLASRLAGNPLTATCVLQRAPVRERPLGRLLLSNTVCAQLLGYAVGQPHVPPVASNAAFAFAATVLGFLRGMARVTRVHPAQLDCRAVGWFAQALHVLGSPTAQARSMRRMLLRRRVRLEQKLSFQPGCRFR